eukprot:g23433.t1
MADDLERPVGRGDGGRGAAYDAEPVLREKTPEEKLQYMSMELADRMNSMEGNRNDLFYYYLDEERYVPASVLLLDKSLRRTAFRDAPGLGSRARNALCYILAAAEAHEDLVVKRAGGRSLVRMNAKQLPKVVEEAKRGYEAAEAAAAAASATEAAASAAEAAAPAAPKVALPVMEMGQRNCKGELGHVVSKRLGRSIAKEDVRVGDHPPSYRATCTVLGESYESRLTHGNKKAAEQDSACRGASQDGTTDFKGQLLTLFQTLGKRDQVLFDVYRVNEDSEEKFFQAKVKVPIEGQEPFVAVGRAMSRSDFESSEKTRRAAQQDAARAALEVLQDRPPPGASGPAVSVERPPETPKPEVQEVVILWLPQDPSEMVSFRKVQVVSDDFLAATEELLGEAVAHPLSWLGNRPKGLSLYEAVEPPVCSVNARATALAGLEVYGESFLMDASAHSRGAGRNWFRASATITKEDDQKWDYGDPSTNKMDTQQDASLKVLHQLQSEDQEQGKRWQHPLVPTVVKAISDHVERTAARKPRRSFVRGSKVRSFVAVFVVFATATANVAVEMLLEKQERLTAAVTGRILHPMLQDLLETLPMGEEVVLRTPCHYEQIACDLELRAQLLELQLPPEPEPPKKVIKFSPPLWKQRQAFIVQALLARCVKSVLDLGCGDGKLLEALLPLGFERLVGLELSEHRTKDARQRLAAAAHGAANGAAAWTVLSGDFVAPEDEGRKGRVGSVGAGSSWALANAMATLYQLVSVQVTDGAHVSMSIPGCPHYIEDQPGYPEMTQALSYRDINGNPLTYSRSDIREMVEFARVRGVSILPEIDGPMHAPALAAALNLTVAATVNFSLPQFAYEPPPGTWNISSLRAMQFVRTALEQAEEDFFTAPFLHVGGDEPTAASLCADCQKYDLIQSAATYPQDGSTYGWLYMDCGSGANWIDMGPNYWCPRASWAALYSLNATQGYGDGLTTSRCQEAFLGAEMALWSEVGGMGNGMALIFPRAAAFAERMWSNPPALTAEQMTGGQPPESYWQSHLRDAMARLNQVVANFELLHLGVSHLQPEFCRKPRDDETDAPSVALKHTPACSAEQRQRAEERLQQLWAGELKPAPSPASPPPASPVRGYPSASKPRRGEAFFPMMSDSEMAPLLVPATEPERIRSTFREHGVCIVTDVISPEDCMALEDLWHDDLLQLLDESKLDPQVAKQAAAVKETVKAWPKHWEPWRCVGLGARVRACAEEAGTNTNPEWLHVDQNHCTGITWTCAQGVLYVWPSGPNDSSTVVWPKSHTEVYDHMMGDPEAIHRESKRPDAMTSEIIRPGRPGLSGQSVKLKELQDAKIREELMRDAFEKSRRVPCPAGSLLLWDSRTVHQGWRGGPRLAMPICWEPKTRRDEAALRRKLWMCGSGVPSSHSAAEGRVHGMAKEAHQPALEDGLPLLRASLVPFAIRINQESDWLRQQQAIWPSDNPKRQADSWARRDGSWEALVN